MLGIQTRGRRMVGADETTKLWQPPVFYFMLSFSLSLSLFVIFWTTFSIFFKSTSRRGQMKNRFIFFNICQISTYLTTFTFFSFNLSSYCYSDFSILLYLKVKQILYRHAKVIGCCIVAIDIGSSLGGGQKKLEFNSPIACCCIPI